MRDLRRYEPAREYAHAWHLFVHGDLEKSGEEAERGYWRFHRSNREWSVRFQLLGAQVLTSRGMYDDSMRLLSLPAAAELQPNERALSLAIEGINYTHQHQLQNAEEKLAQADAYCRRAVLDTCGEVLQAQGLYAAQVGQFEGARSYFLKALDVARKDRDQFLEARAGLNVGWIALQVDRYDEALDWFHSANATAKQIGAADLAETIEGNLGWAYYNLGDSERALALYKEAEKGAVELGNTRKELGWLSTEGYVYQDRGEIERSLDYYRRSLALAQRLNSKEDIVNCLEDLAHISANAGRADDAERYIDQLVPLVEASGSRIDALYVELARGKVATVRHQYAAAEEMFRAVRSAPESQTSMRLAAGHELARTYEAQGDAKAARDMYADTLAAFEAARNQLENEDSKIPFVANATDIYDDYIHFQVAQGQREEALAIADQSRARTLEQGLGLKDIQLGAVSKGVVRLDPTRIARRAGAALLFYWLGEKESYLWAVTAGKVGFFTLPPRAAIVAQVERYRRELLGPEDGFETTTHDGEMLYRMLIEPAKGLVARERKLVVLGDGALNLLNFETLVVPGAPSHFLIEDATLTSAPSLGLLLASTERPQRENDNLLLVGDAKPPDPSYPELPMAGREMAVIERHFAGAKTVLSKQAATPDAYFSSRPGNFGYIHFVAHGTASTADPLESGIVLSPDEGKEGNSFKLYAREIMQHRLHARLVTISACYGSGSRSYAGEGLVGLSWAFLRAGAHNVVGALWEVSDESTPRLMDRLYAGLERGESPAESLRQAKLMLLHTRGAFSRPFYWAPFQLYTGL